jgi:hypothetical protein
MTMSDGYRVAVRSFRHIVRPGTPSDVFSSGPGAVSVSAPGRVVWCHLLHCSAVSLSGEGESLMPINATGGSLGQPLP